MEKLKALQEELGGLGLAALALLALAVAFHALAVKPLEERSRALHAALERGAGGGGAGRTAAQLEELYAYLERSEERTDWLAKLHAIGRATGVKTRSATYRGAAAGERLERYEIVLPVSGSYPQIRDFLKRALAEIPVLSLDQMSLKRETRSEARVQAELRLTLHEVRK